MFLEKPINISKLFNRALLIVLVLIACGVSRAQTINPPTDLEAEPEDGNYIKVKWDDNSNNELGFYIERSTGNDSTWEVIDGVSQNVRQYFDYWVTNQTTYFYRVYAYRDTLRSAYSNIAYATAIVDSNSPQPPTNLVLLKVTEQTISIEWQDNSDNEAGFIIARRLPGEVLFTYIDTVSADVITYQEVGLTPDNLYYYKVCAYNPFGLSDFTNTLSARTKNSTNIVINNLEIPSGFFLGHNYPNPFNPETNIKFGITQKSFVRLVVYNSVGREIETLVNENLTAGTYQVKWNAEKFSSGAYFYRIETGYFSEIKKMILIK